MSARAHTLSIYFTLIMVHPFDGGFSFRENHKTDSDVDIDEVARALEEIDPPLNIDTAMELADVLETKMKFGKVFTEAEQAKVLEKISELERVQNDAMAIGAEADDQRLVQTLVRLRNIRNTFAH